MKQTIFNWEVQDYNQEFSPDANTTYGATCDVFISCDEDGTVMLETELYGHSVTTTVPVEVLRAYIQAYEKWQDKLNESTISPNNHE